jgi:hypothetical protein
LLIFLAEYLIGHDNIENILRQRSLNSKSSSSTSILNSEFGGRVLKYGSSGFCVPNSAMPIENTDKMATDKLTRSYWSLLETPLTLLLEGISKREKYGSSLHIVKTN